MANNEYVEYIKDLLSSFPSLIFKRMFGGYGVFRGKYMVALIASNELYFNRVAKIMGACPRDG